MASSYPHTAAETSQLTHRRIPAFDSVKPSASRILRVSPIILVFPVVCVLAMVTASECHSAVTEVDPHASLIPSIFFGIVMWWWWGLIAALMWALSRRYPAIVAFTRKGILLHTAVGAVLVVLHQGMLQGTIKLIVMLWPITIKAGYDGLNYLNINQFGLELFLYAFMLGVSGFLSLKLRSHQDAVRGAELQSQLTQARLLALQMQMEPHFLFNTLNAIAALVDLRRNEEAGATLEHLNSILRSTLKRGSVERVTLAEEMEVVDSYLAIQQIRFEDRLAVETEVDSAALDGMVPLFLLQPIIENAIRHGISHRQRGGQISTSIRRIGESIELRVRDNGPGIPQPHVPGHGIGLKNTRERLAHFYPSSHDFAIRHPDDGGFEVTITIPYDTIAR
jgi:signal transduction histidine kinase